MYEGFMCVHILQVSGTEIDDSSGNTNIINIEQGHSHTPHTRAILPYSHAVYGHPINGLG